MCGILKCYTSNFNVSTLCRCPSKLIVGEDEEEEEG